MTDLDRAMKRRFLLICAPALLAACQVLPDRPYQQTRTWPLQVARANPAEPAPHGPVVLLRQVQAAPGLQTRSLLSLRDDGSLQANPYELWSAPPAQAVEDQLRAWLAGAGRFAAVVAPGSRLHAALVLEAELTALWAEPAAHRARATLGFNILADRGGDISLLKQGVAEGTAALASNDAPAQAAAQAAALGAAFGEIERALLATMPAGAKAR